MSKLFVFFVDDDPDDCEVMQDCCPEIGMNDNARFFPYGEALLKHLSLRNGKDGLPDKVDFGIL